MFTSRKIQILFSTISILTLTHGIVVFKPSITLAATDANEKDDFKWKNGNAVRPQNLPFNLSYMIYQNGAGEQIFSANPMANIKLSDGTIIPGTATCSRAMEGDVLLAYKFNCFASFFLGRDLQPGEKLTGDVKTEAKVKKTNTLRKTDIVLVPGVPTNIRTSPLLGFEFKNSSSNGTYTLFNDSSSDVFVNSIYTRLNSSKLNLAEFNLETPDLSEFSNLLFSPFTLSRGQSVDFNLGIPLLEGTFSQAFAEFIDLETGETLKKIDEHEHPIPEPSSLLGLLAVGGAGLLTAWFKKG